MIPKAALDVHKLPENQQIRLIGAAAMTGETVGFIVNAEEKVIVRYERKLREWFPQLEVERLGLFTRDSFALRAKKKGETN